MLGLCLKFWTISQPLLYFVAFVIKENKEHKAYSLIRFLRMYPLVLKATLSETGREGRIPYCNKYLKCTQSYWLVYWALSSFGEAQGLSWDCYFLFFFSSPILFWYFQISPFLVHCYFPPEILFWENVMDWNSWVRSKTFSTAPHSSLRSWLPEQWWIADFRGRSR